MCVCGRFGAIDTLMTLFQYLHQSRWCVHEVKEARRHGIPIICVVDADKQPISSVIDGYMAKGFSWLFSEQVQSLIFATPSVMRCRSLL